MQTHSGASLNVTGTFIDTTSRFTLLSAKDTSRLYVCCSTAGADPTQVGLSGDDLVTVARDRGHDAVAHLLEDVRVQRGRSMPADADHPIHVAAEAGDVALVRRLLDDNPQLIELSDRAGGTPLHRAVAASAREVVELLLDRGADINAVHGAGHGSASGYPPAGLQPIDLALWVDNFWGVRGDIDMARLLVDRGASFDVTIAAALGDIDQRATLLSTRTRAGSMKRGRAANDRFHPLFSLDTVTLLSCCLTAALIQTFRKVKTLRADRRYTLLLAQGTDRWSSCCSRMAPIPTAGSILRAAQRTWPRRQSCASC